MDDSRDARFAAQAAALGHSFDGEIKVGGKYVSMIRHGSQAFLSGQLPKVADTVIVVGRVGAEVTLAQAQHAAKVCVMRALAVLRQSLGSLEKVDQALRLTVFIRCTEDFTQHSEVADGASDVLHAVLGPTAGAHTRTSVGVLQLPKNAAVELDLTVGIVD
jgi:enamine deaminase RidA (YjgF/YER057c/UK114 family)